MANRILVLWPSGNVLCEGESALAPHADAAVDAPGETTDGDREPSTDPCPPTMRSRESDASGIFRRAERAA